MTCHECLVFERYYPIVMHRDGISCSPFVWKASSRQLQLHRESVNGRSLPRSNLDSCSPYSQNMPPIATDYVTATSSLQGIADACSLLLQQRRLFKNAPAFAASAAQYALTNILPMPHLDSAYCFWRKNDMRRETQVNLLFLIRRICRIYSAATICVQ